MSSESPTHGSVVRTLQDAHRQVARQWPGRHATAEAFRAYHEYAARIYEQVARTDDDHYHEALYWAQQARQNAEGFAEQISASTDTGGST